MAEWSLVCPFLTDDVMFAYGVEFGLLYARMKLDEPIADYFCRANQERVLLLANRLHWSVKQCRPHGQDWFFCELWPPAGR